MRLQVMVALVCCSCHHNFSSSRMQIEYSESWRSRFRPSIKTVFPGIGITNIKTRLLWGRLVFVMGIPILAGRHLSIATPSGPWFKIKMSSYRYRKSHCGDKTVVRSSYLHNGISYTGKMTSFYWSRALVSSLIGNCVSHIFVYVFL